MGAVLRREGAIPVPIAIPVDLIGSIAAVLTTLCWLPQSVRIIRYRDTAAISLVTNVMLLVGILLWMIYGLLIGSMPVVLANAVSGALIATIVAMKLRFG